MFETAQATTPASEPERADSPTEGDGVVEAAAVPDAVESTAAGDLITVPDVVGKDHQLAQDTMQAAGLYNLSEEDASGEGRLLLLDRNWTTVAQDPPLESASPATRLSSCAP